MYSIFTLASLFYFIIAIFLAFYIPGRVVLGKQKILSQFAAIVISLVVGLVLWGWQGFIFGYMHVRWLSYIYLLVFIFLYYFQQRSNVTIKQFSNLRKIRLDWFLVCLIAIGIIAQTLPYYTMGWQTKQGVSLNTYNEVDHVWHAALVRELVTRFPPNEPGMAGILLKDYHYWFDLITAELIRVFHLPLFPTQFLGMYILGSLLFGLTAYLVARTISQEKSFLRWFFFFLYFSGDMIGYFMLVIQHRFVWTVGSINDATTLMDGPPFAYSMVIAFAAVYLLFTFRKNLSPKLFCITALLFGTLAGFKIYTAIVFLTGLLALGAYDAIKKQYQTLMLCVASASIAAVIFFADSSGAGSIFFLPFDIPRGFFGEKQFGLSFIEQRWRIYAQHHNLPRVIEYDIFMTAVFLLVEFGIRLLGMYPLSKTRKTLGEKAIFFYGGIIIAFIMGFFFYQKIGGANIWEFFLPALIILSIPAALNISMLSNKNKMLAIAFALLIITLTLPRWIVSTSNNIYYEYFHGFNGISTNEMQSLLFLKHNTPGKSIILVLNRNYLQNYASIFSVLADRDLFLSGTGVRQIITPEIKKRIADINTIQYNKNASLINGILHKDKIDYIYIYDKPEFKTRVSRLNLKNIFQNKTATILKVV